MNDIENEVRSFFNRLPNATESQARRTADEMFTEGADQREFLRQWSEYRDRAREIRQAEFKSDVDRIWPKEKYD